MKKASSSLAGMLDDTQKKMVPSDPQTNSFSDRHARPEHGIWNGVT